MFSIILISVNSSTAKSSAESSSVLNVILVESSLAISVVASTKLIVLVSTIVLSLIVLSDTLGLKWQIISKRDALQLTKDTVNPYDGAPAFFLGDKVYFIQDRMTSDLVLHDLHLFTTETEMVSSFIKN